MKIKEIIQKHYAILIPIILIIVLLLAYAIFNIQKYYTNYSKTETNELYTFFAGQKIKDKFSIKTNRRNEVIELSQNKDIEAYTPIYNKERNKVIFPNDMTIVLVNENYKQKKVNKYTTISYDNTNTKYTLKTTSYEKELDNFILYDGTDLYFLPEESILYIDNEKIELSPMSFVICNNNNSLEYYNNENDKYTIKEIKNEKINLKSNNYNINLNEDKIERTSNLILLTKPEYLDIIK